MQPSGKKEPQYESTCRKWTVITSLQTSPERPRESWPSASSEELLYRSRVGSHDPQKAAIIDSDESTVIMGVQEGVEEPNKIGALIEKAKFYTSLCMGTTAILAVFAFLFLIPFVVEPAITTILADFSPHPVACVTTGHVYAEGLKNCSWASCREGESSIPFMFAFSTHTVRM